MNQHLVRAAAPLSICIGLAAPARAGSFTYTYFSSGGNLMTPLAIDDSDRVVGSIDVVGNTGVYGFTWIGGTATTVVGSTSLGAISSSGIAAGYLQLAQKRYKYVTYDVSNNVLNTYAHSDGVHFYDVSGINAAGIATVDIENERLDNSAFEVHNGNFSHFVFPKARSTSVNAISDAGVVAGAWEQPTQPYTVHSFTMQNGKFASFDPPDATWSAAYGTTSDGTTYGRYYDIKGYSYGYTLKAGQFTTIQYPASLHTNLAGIGPGGEVVGWFADKGTYYGFIHIGGKYYKLSAFGGASMNIYGVNALGSIIGIAPGGFIAQCAADQFPCTK